VTVTATGWQHGDVPAPPAGLLKASQKAWATWMGAWFAAHWTPGDLPGLWVVIGLYDRVERGEFHRSAEWRMWADTYGITPKGVSRIAGRLRRRPKHWRRCGRSDRGGSDVPRSGKHQIGHYALVVQTADRSAGVASSPGRCHRGRRTRT
jgi:hypothetical protein